MSQNWYRHPQRHPKNVDGPFYSLAYDVADEKNCHSECLDCDLPQSEAESLIKNLYDNDGDTYFVRQPQNPRELANAISATSVCCVDALRYAGDDPEIIRRMESYLCDYEINVNGDVCLKHT